ncbi:MAG: DUF262 domain-containing protein [Acidobacteria bacterium]|nr:DUF262 domain-containing protein [Acidobacteriota bacterium]
MPDYQRGYSWGTKNSKQLSDLWNDLENLDTGTFHFTGVITLEKVTFVTRQRWEKEFEIREDLTIAVDGKSHIPYFVVDGQQRLVSLITILSILSRDPDLLDKRNAIANAFVSKHVDGRHYYLFGYEKDTPSHQYLIGEIFEDSTMEVMEPETIYTQNLLKAKKFFSERIDKMNSFEKRRLFEKISKCLLFNILEIESQKLDISLVFETLNYRGKPLSKLELLKNRLIYLVMKRHPERSNALRQHIIDTWQDIYEWLGKNKRSELDDDDFLRAFWIMFYKHDEDRDKVSVDSRRTSLRGSIESQRFH